MACHHICRGDVCIRFARVSQPFLPVGPHGFRIHEIRGWQQQQPDCHSFAKHDVGFYRDAIWQMHCEQVLEYPPELRIEASVTQDRFYNWLENTWRWQQLPLTLVLFAWGGAGFVLWGICLRVAVSLSGHWCTVHFAHTTGQRPFVQKDIAVDGRNLPMWGLFTFGEAFHNNHHAFPRSARMGFSLSQIDPGWWAISGMSKIGWVWNIRVPDIESARTDDFGDEILKTSSRYRIWRGIKPDSKRD